MDSVDSASMMHRPDLTAVQLIHGQGQNQTGQRHRPVRAYQRQQRPALETAPATARSGATVLLELSGDGHALSVYADYSGSDAAPLHVRIVDAKTTETVGEMEVTSTPGGQRLDDYQRLRFPPRRA